MILLASMTRRTSTGDTSRSSPGYGDDGAIVGAANMVAGDPDEDVRHVEAGHSLGLFRGGLDRLDRLVQVDHDPLAHPHGRRFPDPDDFEPVWPVNRNDRAGLGRSDIEPANGLVLHPMLTLYSWAGLDH